MTYGWVAGTGGLGAGITMRLVGDTTLGREESRAAELLDARDSCKLHIVLHYVQRLLGPGFPVHPIGAVGDDEAGRTVLEELRAVGMDVAGVRVIPDAPTLYAVAFVYPNGDGGNLTTTGSASDRVGPADLDSAADLLAGAGGVVVALPEVPIAARAALLARASGSLRVAALVSGEADQVDAVLEHADLVALNADEARAIVGEQIEDPAALAARVISLLRARFPRLWIVLTAGAAGSWSWDGDSLEHAQVPAAEVVSTAGAGDAHLGGIITGLVLGATLHEANRLGAVVSSLKVGSAHTIHPGLDALAVTAAIAAHEVELPQALRAALG